MNMPRTLQSISILFLTLPCIRAASSVGRNDSARYAANLLQESMNWMDMYYDSEAGYLYSLSAAALTHETRASAWYASGLFARNEGNDVEQAVKIITNVIDGQHKNVSSQW
jgi:hypothetical protein